MAIMGRMPGSGLVCPRCAGNLASWSRANLVVEFCDQCSALFLDRGELFEMFRAEGYRCPPEAFLRAGFTPREGEPLVCPKCEKPTLVPGAVEGCEVWHCTPCNGFLVERELLIGGDGGESLPESSGFIRRAAAGVADDEAVGSALFRTLRRIAFWTPPATHAPD